MAKRAKTVFVCQECGYESPKWLGQCICGAWNSFIEERVPEPGDSRRRTSARNLAEDGSRKRAGASRLRDVGAGERNRFATGIGELDRVLGGGLVKGSLVLISGEPGIGKSTVIIQAAANIAASGTLVLYVSGEESEEQIRMRADRVCRSIPEGLYTLAETNMENVMAVCEELKPGFVIMDSIQTMYTDELGSAPGSVSQVRACGNLLMKIGKNRDIPVFIVAHVTKSGDLAGPKTIEHLVDAVLSFSGERGQDLRILRAFKNRFGTTSEIGAFRMEEKGLVELRDLSATFLDGSGEKPEGSVVSAVYEGSRPVLLEIQALTAPANVGFARRTAVGIDHQRLAMILAVLEKKLGLTMINQDVYANIVGGLRPDSTSTDLAVALAVFSSLRGVRCPRRLIACGEVGLTGELRQVANMDKIAAEAARMGYQQLIVPLRNADELRAFRSGELKISGCRDLRAAIEAFRAR